MELFFWGIHMMNKLLVKPAKTYDEQVDLLIKRGLIINNKEDVKKILSRLNYYTFTGYLHDFKTDDENYIKGLTFEKVYAIYEFDKRFRNILSYAIEIIEHTLKTKVAYNFAHSFSPVEYLNDSVFKDKSEHNIFIKKFNENFKNNRNISFVKHHITKYNSIMPIWVAVDIFTMGMLYNFYKNLPTKNQKEIAGEFNTGVNQLKSWIENITYLRNMTAHYMRIYNYKMQKTPLKCKYNHTYYQSSYMIFDIILIMKFLILDFDDWNNFILEGISSLIEKYYEFIDLKCIGFPENWKEILIK